MSVFAGGVVVLVMASDFVWWVQAKKEPPLERECSTEAAEGLVGDDLLSHRVAPAVPSAS